MKKGIKSFTLIEMLIVLAIIAVLILLFVPNLVKEKDKVKETGSRAIVKVVESQAELYRIDHTGEVKLSELLSNGLISQQQADNYNDYYAKNKNESRSIPN
ncbi:competence type IV pilus major pilin ComGC [Lactococcus termiticola]|uniref:Competence protein ComGC n=1 Tax=Lactococcus termiticola TaxID=2169526 RepID=A0A2R5HJ42_9LACT|nr:competence type IV pilus major pilin ComGC [Lactococcus termiticola]GBG96500.1 competence protein ComGC [Lactococcus termiticola]